MNAFLPAVAFLNRLRYPQKFLLVSCCFIIPLVMSLYLLISELNSQIRFAEKERLGVEYNCAVRRLIDDLQQHRGMASALLNGDQSFREKLTAKEAQIADDIGVIDGIDQRTGKLLKTNDQWYKAKTGWNALQNSLFKLKPQESFNNHTALITEFLELSNRVAANSNLLLDPKLDTNYLVDVVNNKLLVGAEKMGQARAAGSGVAAKKLLTPDEKIQLIILSKNIQAAFEDVSHGLEIAYQENSSLKINLESASQENSAIVIDFLAIINTQLINTQSINIKATDYFATATKAIDTSYKVYDLGVVALDNMLKMRIESYEEVRFMAIAIALAIFLLVFYLLQAFYLSVKDTVAKLEFTATLVADGDLTARVDLQTRDELSLVGKAFNKMTGSLNEIVSAVYQTVDQMSGASREIAAATAETNESITAVTKSIQQVAADAETGGHSIEEASRVLSSLAYLVQTAKAQAVATATESNVTLEVAAKGRATAEELMTRMSDIKTSMHETEGLMNTLNDYLGQIRLINEMITNIAHQTNLLALNAAIEAARAGEHGRGFAVVAEEVKKLAEQSNQGASEVTAIIAKIANGTATAVLATQHSKAEVELGVNAFNQVGRALDDIVAAAGQTQNNVNDIVRITGEEVAASERIVKFIESIAAGISNTAKQSQEVSAATEETNATTEAIVFRTEETGKTAQHLQKLVSRFKI